MNDDGAVELSVLVPVYRSAAILPELVRRLAAVLEQLGRRYELIFVDDGSPDGSWQVLQQLQAADPEHIIAIQLMRNFGQHNALMCGLRHSQGRYVVTIDDDLQHPPEEIPRLLETAVRGRYDLVYGAYASKRHAWGRNLGSGLVNAFYRIAFRTRTRVTSFRVMSRPLVDTILSYTLNFIFLDGLLAWNTTRIGECSVEHHPRAHGRSGYSIGKLLGLALNLFTSFSVLPLRCASALGVGVAFGGLAAAAYYLARYVASDIHVPGYASTIVAIMILGGTQLLAIGVMGEYLGRLHINANGKPQYSQRTVLDRRAQREPATARHARERDGSPLAHCGS
ncbi:MAG TPA: glycosyltransferase family 2 protein [Planctomycetaceae bacterium]|nr:glycosyltransferase family 2 protein [Planctomycetaceae bacterium]